MKQLLALLLILALALPAAAQGSLTAALQAPAQANPTVAGAWVDFAALLRKAGQTASFRPGSVVVRPAGAAEAVPARVQTARGIYQVFWRVPAAANAAEVGTAREFEVEFGTAAGAQATPTLPEGVVDNLVDNGGFERVSADGVPDGIAPAVFRRDLRWVGEAGGHALALNADPEGEGPAYTTPWVSVRPGESYVYSFRHRARGAVAHPRYKLIAYGYANYQDAQGKYLTRKATLGSRSGDTGGWERYRVAFTTPPGAASANLQFNNGSKVPYSVFLGDVRIAPADLPQVVAARAPDGRRVSLRVEGPNVRRFDLGPAGSSAWEGFDALTPEVTYEAERGYGFTRMDQPVPSDKRLPDALARDFLCAARADLRVDLPDGDYTLWMLSGDSQVGSTITYIYRDQHVEINGAEALNRDLVPAQYFRTAYFRHYRDFWHPGMDYYDTFIASNFEEKTFPAAAAGGKLAISWRNVPVCALVISPRARDAEMREELARLRADRKRAAPVEEVPGPREKEPVATAGEKARGFILFRRPDSEAVYPGSRPRPGERSAALRVFAAPGQYQSAHFSLLPLRDLGGVRVRATELRAGARRIPAAAVDVRVARYIFRSAGSAESSAYRYQVSPFVLDRHEPVPAPAGTTWSWWATVRIPEGAGPGVYQGALEILPARGKPYRVPLAVRVLPIKLAALPIPQGYYYFPQEPWYATFWGANVRGPRFTDDPDVRRIIEERERGQMRFMRTLGLNSISFSDDMRGDMELIDGKVRFKPGSRFAWWMDLYKEEGMGPMPFYGFQPIGAGNSLSWLDPAGLKEPFTPQWNAAYRSVVEEGQRLQKERGWPEILWYISDELSNHGEPGGKLGVQLGQALEGMPGVRTIASMNGTWEHSMVPHVSISMPNFAFPITEATVKMVRDAGSQLWLYNCGEERLNMGLHTWRVGAGGRFQWHYHCMNADPWDDLDGSYGDSVYSLALPGPNGPVPAIKSQIVRDAVDDHRYVATLERAIAAAAAKPAKRAAVAKAMQFLQDLRRRIPVDVRTLVGYQVDPRAAGAALGGEFRNTDALDRVRWAAAALILELEAR